jgi:hypothetical protein
LPLLSSQSPQSFSAFIKRSTIGCAHAQSEPLDCHVLLRTAAAVSGRGLLQP